MTQEIPVQEDELHAYVDGELPPERREAVAVWLAANPEQAALVAGWQAQAEAIRARYGAVLDEPMPARLRLDALLRGERSGRRRWVTFAAAAAMAAFLVGGATGWFTGADRLHLGVELLVRVLGHGVTIFQPKRPVM